MEKWRLYSNGTLKTENKIKQKTKAKQQTNLFMD
jgi:hypothetical protein